MSKSMSAEEAREALEFVDAFVEGDIGSYSHHAWIGAIKKLRPFVQAHADMLDRQTPDVSGLVEALEAFAAMRPDSSEASEKLGTMRLTWEADTDLFTAPIEMTKRARQALSTFKGGEDE